MHIHKRYIMTLDDARVYSLNSITLMISYSTVEDTLKLILLIASIGYTIQRWYFLRKKNE